MASSVHDFKDIPHLFVNEGDNEMGSTRRSTPDKLNKIIQFIWLYQQEHNGASPALNLIERQFNISNGGGGYWINLLVDSGRLNRISVRPFRATITEHKDNRIAIERFKKIRAKIEEQEAEERDRIRATQEHQREQEQREADRNAVLETMTASDETPQQIVMSEPERAVVATPTPAIPLKEMVPGGHLEPHIEDTVKKFTRSRTETREATRLLKPAMPQLIKIADTRDLVFELIERGYHVSK